MIEISHQQAQRLIREGMDSTSGGRRLPEEQWAALQAHLEYCPDCQAYARQRQATERDLTRVLHLRWNPVVGPGPNLPGQVIERNRQKIIRRQRFKKIIPWVGIGLIVITVLILRGLFSPAEVPQATVTPTTKAIVALSTPTPLGVFRGVLALESRHTGNHEIFILNAGPAGIEMTNLTNHPAEDTFPAWSPDGEWIAFLSNRETTGEQVSRSEIYVMHVAGSRITRLTADPRLDWQGPLSWSMDGRWIAARASRQDQGGDRYIYLVPLDESSPRTPGLFSVAFSRNSGIPRFSPLQHLLAFQSRQPEGHLLGYHLDTGSFVSFNGESLAEDGLRANGPFDWAVGGVRLVYISEGPYHQDLPPQMLADRRSEVHISPAIDLTQRTSISDSGDWIIDSGDDLGLFRAVGSVPHSLLIYMVQDPDGDGCWTIHLKPSNRLDLRTREITGLCLEGNLAEENWLPLEQPTQAERWLVVLARREKESTVGLFAVRLNTGLDSPDATLIERLAVPEETNAALPGEPRARPAGFRLSIRPHAVEPARGRLPPLPLEPMEDIPLIASANQTGGQDLLRFNAGKGWQTILTGSEFTCPTLSPTGSRIAFVSYAPIPGTQINDVFLYDLAGGNPARQLTSVDLSGPPTSFTGATSRYGCPVWSPDGNQLAAVLFTSHQTYLVVIPVDSSDPPAYLAIDPVSPAVPPVWKVDENGQARILLFYPSTLTNHSRIVSLDLSSETNRSAMAERGQAEVETLLDLPGYREATAMSVSPDGQRIAMVLIHPDTSSTRRTPLLADFATGSFGGELLTLSLENYDPAQARANSLAWLPKGRIGLLNQQTYNQIDKARLEIFDPITGKLTSLIGLEDQVYNAAWTADGHWVFYTSESGLWGLFIPGAIAGDSAPARLLSDITYDLDVP